jgi:hypothetical protein
MTAQMTPTTGTQAEIASVTPAEGHGPGSPGQGGSTDHEHRCIGNQ